MTSFYYKNTGTTQTISCYIGTTGINTLLSPTPFLCIHYACMFDKQIQMNIKPFDYYSFDGCVRYIKRPVVTMSSVSNSALEIDGRVGLRLETLDTPVTESAFLSLAIFIDPWRLVFHDLLAPVY